MSGALGRHRREVADYVGVVRRTPPVAAFGSPRLPERWGELATDVRHPVHAGRAIASCPRWRLRSAACPLGDPCRQSLRLVVESGLGRKASLWFSSLERLSA